MMESEPVAPPTPNRRLSPRRRPKRSSRVFCAAGKYGLGPNVAAALLDVSETGARLVVTMPLPAGREVEVGLEAIGQRGPSLAPAQVMWCVALADGNHCVGVRFDKSLKYTLFQALAAL